MSSLPQEPLRPVSPDVVEQLKDAVELLAASNRQQKALAALLADVSLSVAGGGSVCDMLRTCTDAVVRHLAAAFARAWTLAPGAEMLELQASSGMYTHTNGGHARVPVGSYKIGRIAAKREPHLSNSVPDDPEVSDHSWARENGILAFAGYPLLCEGRLVGVLAAFSRMPFAEVELDMLGSVATVIAQAIERKRAEENETRRSIQLHKLAAAAAAINREQSTDSVLRVITEQAREIVGAHQAVTSVTVNNQWAQAINAVSMSDKYARWRDYATPTNGSGIYSLVCRTNAPMRMTQGELERHPAWRGFGEHAADHPPMRGWLAAPLISVSGENLGLIQLSDKYDGEFDVQDQDILVQLAHMASGAVESSRFRDDAEKGRRELEELQKVALVISSELDLEKAVQAVTDACVRLSGAEFGAFFYNVIDNQGGKYLLYTLSGAPAEKFIDFGMPRATSLFGPTFRGEGVIRSDDIRQDARYGQNAPHFGLPPGHLPVVSYLAVPVITSSGEVIGGLFFGHPEPGTFSERSEKAVVTLAAWAAVAVGNARRFQKLAQEKQM